MRVKPAEVDAAQRLRVGSTWRPMGTSNYL